MHWLSRPERGADAEQNPAMQLLVVDLAGNPVSRLSPVLPERQNRERTELQSGRQVEVDAQLEVRELKTVEGDVVAEPAKAPTQAEPFVSGSDSDPRIGRDVAERVELHTCPDASAVGGAVARALWRPHAVVRQIEKVRAVNSSGDVWSEAVRDL